MTNVIVGVLHHSVYQLKKILDELEIKYYVYSEIKNTNIDPSKRHIIFNNLTQLANAFSKDLIKKTPILLETASVLNQISLNENVVYIDAKVNPDGMIFFEEVNEQLLVDCCSSIWKKTPKNNSISKFTKSAVVQHGTSSLLADSVNNILNSLPSCTHIPFMIALVKGVDDKFKSFNKFLKDTRLVNRENKKYFEELNDYLLRLESVFKYFTEKDKKRLLKVTKTLTSDDVNNFKRMRFYIKTFCSYNLVDYLDDEKNIKMP